MLPKLLLALKQENFVAVFISKSASSLPQKTHIQNYQLCYGRTEVRSLNFPPYFFLFIYNESRDYVRFQGSLMHLLSESLRPRVVIYLTNRSQPLSTKVVFGGWHLMPTNETRVQLKFLPDVTSFFVG